MGALAFLLRFEELTALAAAVTAHELGHVIALILIGARMDGVSFTGTGPVLHFAAVQPGIPAASAALSGPLAGAVFWAAALRAFPLAAEMSFVLTAVNLLPVLPLDGGRVLCAVVMPLRFGARLMRLLRVSVITGLALLGAYCLFAGWGGAPLLSAIWLAVVPGDPSCSCKTGANDVQCTY